MTKFTLFGSRISGTNVSTGLTQAEVDLTNTQLSTRNYKLLAKKTPSDEYAGVVISSGTHFLLVLKNHNGGEKALIGYVFDELGAPLGKDTLGEKLVSRWQCGTVYLLCGVLMVKRRPRARLWVPPYILASGHMCYLLLAFPILLTCDVFLFSSAYTTLVSPLLPSHKQRREMTAALPEALLWLPSRSP